MNEEQSLAIIDLFAKKQRDGHFACPRCGRMNKDTEGALSRRAAIYICDNCGIDEALEDMAGSISPLASWRIAQLPELWCIYPSSTFDTLDLTCI